MRKQMHTPDESVDLCGLDIIQLLDGVLDLTLVGLDIHDEDQGVVFLNLLHGRFRVQWPEQNRLLGPGVNLRIE